MPYKDKASRTCGFVDVAEKEKTAKFTRRFLRLDKSTGVLEWFADNPSNLPKNSQSHGTIDVNFITKVDIPAKLKFKARHCFVVNTPMRRYYFQANDETDMEDWVEILTNASKIVVSDDDLDPIFHGEVSVESSKASQEYSYRTEIVAGVVVQKKMDEGTPSPSAKVKQWLPSDDSRSLKSVANTINNGSPIDQHASNPAKKIKEGWCVKQGHLRKNWKRRYFILTTSGFSYYKSNQDKEPIRFVPLSELLTAKVDETSLSDHKDNLFFVATTERIYYIQADSPQDMKDWVKSFRDAIQFSSLKLKSKGSNPGELTPEQGYRVATGLNVAKKLDASPSLASASLRNSVHLGKLNANQCYSVASYRLSSADEALYRSIAPRGKKTQRSLDRCRVASSSEESGGLSSSVDSLTASFAEARVNNQSPKERPKSTKRKYKRSCSGSEVHSTEIKPTLKPNTEHQTIDRRSYPPSESYFKPGTPETKIPTCASFHSPEGASSESFSSTKSVRPSRSFLLDPKVDHRAAVKPSTVKKKRNPGILFSLNNMLNKKAEKMTSSTKKWHF